MTAGINAIVAVPVLVLRITTKSKGKIRGMESLGMICSLQELGFTGFYYSKRIF